MPEDPGGVSQCEEREHAPDLSWYKEGAPDLPPEPRAPRRRGVRWFLCLAIVLPLCLIACPLVVFWMLRTDPAPEVDMWEARVLSALDTYTKLEGDAKRGKHFEALTMGYEMWIRNGGPRAEGRMMALLGPPDRVAPTTTSGKMYAYLYDRSKKKDWACYATVVNGRVTLVAWNDSSVNKTLTWPKYAPLAKTGQKPASAPKVDYWEQQVRDKLTGDRARELYSKGHPIKYTAEEIAALKGLLDLGPGATGALQRLLESESKYDRRCLLVALRRFEHTWPIPLTVKACDDDDHFAAVEAVETLEKLADRLFFTGMRKIGGSPSGYFRVVSGEQLKQARKAVDAWWKREGKAKCGRGAP